MWMVLKGGEGGWGMETECGGWGWWSKMRRRVEGPKVVSYLQVGS